MASDKFNLSEICSKFDIDTNIQPYGNGHINDTYLCETAPRFILQRLNTNVFENPAQVMNNIVNVTRFLSKKIEEIRQAKRLRLFSRRTERVIIRRTIKTISECICL